MPRIGELLVSVGLLTVEQVEQALRAQVMWGGRVGTNLVELGCLDLDTLAKGLGRQHRLPAALGRHFDRGDRALQQRLSQDVAERYSCVPLFRVGPEKTQIVVASIARIDARGLAIIADELEVAPDRLVPSVAAELRVRYQLERIYNIQRSARFLRSRGKSIPPFPHFDIEPVAPEDSQVEIILPTDTAKLPALEKPAAAPADRAPPASTLLPLDEIITELDAEEASEAARRSELAPAPAPPPAPAPRRLPPALVVDDPQLEIIEDEDEDEGGVPEPVVEADSSGRERRKYVPSLEESPADAGPQALGRIAIRRVALPGAAPEGPSPGNTLGEAARAIRRSKDRDRVAELVIETLDRFVPDAAAAVLLVVRGELAIGWKGFRRGGEEVPELGVPLTQPGLVPRVIAQGASLRAIATDLGAIDQLLLVSLGRQAGELVVVPVTIGEQVMCVIALAADKGAEISGAESVAAAAGAAFARMMRDASR